MWLLVYQSGHIVKTLDRLDSLSMPDLVLLIEDVRNPLTPDIGIIHPIVPTRCGEDKETLSLEALNITAKGVVGAVNVCVCCKSRSRDVRKPPTGCFASKDNEAYDGK
ncbi:hypothetical protein KC318_g6 [Hortaea werneckii]|nr:hypothetical protein KC334_g6 [Hortaea werneckii]KAI7028384.1 hypothetical protein KC355_g6 [Hortaea werneckii]KAI7676804.1 hypothetical protein KC318_g6 [Hortaea werneckii]